MIPCGSRFLLTAVADVHSIDDRYDHDIDELME
jgi:hypothetical protein